MQGQDIANSSSFNNPYTLHQTLSGHLKPITAVAWSPDGQYLASSSLDSTIRLWNGRTGAVLHTIPDSTIIWNISWSPDGQIVATSSLDGTIRLYERNTGNALHLLSGHKDLAWSIVWSPDGQYLASGSLDLAVRVWNTHTGELLYTFSKHTEPVTVVAWSPDSQYLASGSLDSKVYIWNIQTGALFSTLVDHTTPIKSLFWSSDGRTLTSFSHGKEIIRWNVTAENPINNKYSGDYANLFSGFVNEQTIAYTSNDHSISLLDLEKNQVTDVLEGHTGPIRSLASSVNGEFLASFAFSDLQRQSGVVRIWRRSADAWILETVIQDLAGESSISFHPEQKALVITDRNTHNINLWIRDDTTYSIDALLKDTVYYKNAKVVLVGDSGVGKSGLWLVLTKQKFVPTESTHGRHVWTFYEQKFSFDAHNMEEIREILLWDLAGQPGYRLIHQLHLDEVNVALVLFDARSETDPFAGVVHWERALRQAERIRSKPAPPLKKFLVAARVDRGGVGVSAGRLEMFMQKFDFQRLFQTSAKIGTQIDALRNTIEEAIIWEDLPRVSSTRLFQTIKNFLLTAKKEGRLLDTVDGLYHSFIAKDAHAKNSEDLYAKFEVCIGLLESAGLIKKLSFGNLVLLQPEILDAYASALINAVKDEPEGFGSITEERVRNGAFAMPEDERLKNKEQERMLLRALIEDLFRRELVLREGDVLIFPSQSTREYPDLPEPEEKPIFFDFEGPVLNIYTTLAVRLANSGIFKRDELWKKAITYTASVGGTCGIILQSDDEGRGELSLFFDSAANEQTRFQFEDYIQKYLQSKALLGSVKRRRIFVCDECHTPLTEKIVQNRITRGFTWLKCPVCDTEISLLDGEKRLSSLNQQIDREADRRRERETLKSKLQGKIAGNEFDVYFLYNKEDRSRVKEYAEQLQEQGILPWLEEWDLQPGLPRLTSMEEQIATTKSAAIFVGKSGMAAWTRLTQQVLLSQFIERGCRVIPVLLPEAPETPDLPPFIKGITLVDFRQKDPDPLKCLIWGITGEKPGN